MQQERMYLKMKKIGIYVHIPFCKLKCIYCDFISYSGKNDYINSYLQSLKEEIIETNKTDLIVDTIYIGGGTPSYIEKEYISDILNTIKTQFEIEKDTEIQVQLIKKN